MKPARLIVRVCLLLSLLVITTAHGAVLDILSGTRLNAQTVMDWCATPASATIESVNAGGCELQVMKPDDINRSFDSRTFWMRMDLANPGSTPEERWIAVGHPRTAEISLFSPNPHGWTRRDAGNRVPMAARGKIERDYGVLPVTIPPRGQLSVWLRVRSETAVDLSTTVWQPEDFLQHNQLIQFRVTLALGGVMMTIVFSLLMYFLTRQIAYLYFALAFGATLFNASLTAGLLQRYIWPAGWPLPTEMIAFSTVVGVLGYYGFMTALMPQIGRFTKTCRIFRGCVLFTVLGLIYAMTGSFGIAARLWGLGMLLTFASGTVITYLAWRDGDRVAGIILLAFGILQFFLVAIRLSFAIAKVTWFPEAALIAPWTLVVTSPVILLGLVSRTKQLLAELTRAQVESDTQLAFLAQMSHELRSPLDSILGNAQLLARQQQNARCREGFSNIFDSGRQLLNMIDHILDYARGMAGVIKMKPEPVVLASFLRGIERMARLNAARQGNRLVFAWSNARPAPNNLTIMLDAEHLRRVLENLISNAARHTQNGVITVDLKTSAIARKQKRLDFSVADTGEGIAIEHQKRIFRPFEQVRQEGARNDKGVGLGLAIARQFTELMGGQLTVESQPGEGAIFRFSIVAAVVKSKPGLAEVQPEAIDAGGYSGRRRTILLVDDDRKTRAVLAELLEDLGFIIIEADNGETASEWLETGAELDLVITDQYMPGGDGWMVLAMLLETRPEVPALLVSAAPPSPPPDWPPHCRFEGVFLRPVDHGKLIGIIGDILELTWTESSSDKHPITTVKPQQSGDEQLPASLNVPGKPDLSALNELRKLVETGQVTAIKEWATALKARSPEHTAFTDGVLEAVEALDFKTLKRLCGESG